MTSLNIITQQLFALSSSEFRLACLCQELRIDEVTKVFVRGTCLNFRPTFHGYYLDIPSIDLKVIVFVQAHVEAVFTPVSGFIFRHPECYLAQSGSMNTMISDANTLYQTLDTAPISDRHLPVAIFSGSQKHLAHYLWNHLASLWRFLATIELFTDSIDVFVTPQSELYGPLSKIYERFKVAHFVSGFPGEIRLQTNVAIIPFILIEPYENKFIPQGLIDSIVYLAVPEAKTPTSTTSSFVYSPRPYSRRPANRLDVFSSFLQFISSTQKSPDAKLIIDISSCLWCNDAIQNEDEIRLSEELVDVACKVLPSAQIIPLVSSPIFETLGILSETCFGVYEWGANLSWYSWLLRKPVISLGPPSVNQRLQASQKYLETWGSFFWESDSPSPMCPSTGQATASCIDTKLRLNRFAPDDYIVDIGEFTHMMHQTYQRICRQT
jgi:hypothetical protein